MWRFAHNYKQRHFVSNYSVQFIWLVPDTAVVRQCNPALRTDGLKPHLILTIWGEMVTMSLDGNSSGRQYVGELGAEISVGEENNRQAARS